MGIKLCCWSNSEIRDTANKCNVLILFICSPLSTSLYVLITRALVVYEHLCRAQDPLLSLSLKPSLSCQVSLVLSSVLALLNHSLQEARPNSRSIFLYQL